MGAYLNKPKTERDSEDDSLGKMRYGASSMQGWRISQEDAHNCLLKFDESTSLFAVYDGHGGSEVADYTAENLPDFLKNIPSYKDGKMDTALEEAFLKFDATLTEDEVVESLKELAGMNADDDEQDEEEAEKLTEEADMPMEELMKRYGYSKDGEDSAKPQIIRSLRKKENIQSPVIKAKKDADQANGDVNDDGVKLKLEDQLVNGHADKVNDAKPDKASDTAPDSTQSAGKVTNSITDLHDGDVSSSTTDRPTGSAAASSQAQDTSGGSSTAAVGSSTAAVGSSTAAVGSSTAVGSSADLGSGDGGGGGSSMGGSSAPDCTSATVDVQSSKEASSSSGRVRKVRAGVIPEEGEDESSFDEEEEDTDEDDSDNEAQPWKSGSSEEDDSEDEIIGPFVGDDEDGDDDEDEIMTGGEDPGKDSGCTAVVAVMRDSQLYVANAGDSRCVLCRAGNAIDLSEDHKPEDEVERRRIEKAGGRITADGRVNGGLNLSRAIGDHCYKKNATLPDRDQMITALPDIRTASIEADDEFMVLACDGIWNVMSSQDVVIFVRERLRAGVTKLSAICEEMFDLCLAPDTYGDGTGCDNMTCIIVTFGNHFQVDNPVAPPTVTSGQISETTTSQSQPQDKSDNVSEAVPANSGAAMATDDQVESSNSKRKAEDSPADSSDTKKPRTQETSSNA